MKNFVSDGNVIKHTLTANALSGDVVLDGSLVGVAVSNGLATEKIALSTEGVFNIPAASGDTFALGAKVGYDISAKEAIASGHANSDGNIGICTEAKIAGSLYVQVKLVQGLA